MASGKLIALLFALAAVAATVQPSEARIQGLDSLERRQDADQVLRASTPRRRRARPAA